MKALLFIWNNRTMTMSVTQIVLSQLATSTLISDYAVKWCMLGTGILTGLIALHNKVNEIKARKESENAPVTE
jgi:hypothetical protein